MRKTKVVSTSNINARKRRHLQEYFDSSHQNVVTPNQRSLPKYKNMFNAPKNHKPSKHDHLKEKRQSIGKVANKKENMSPPHRPHRSNHKPLKFEESINREYDSPSREHEEIDYIVKGVQKKARGNSFIETNIEKVNEHLKNNRLIDAINTLKEALQIEHNHTDLQYLLGICYIFHGSYEQAIYIFEEMMRNKPKKNTFLLLSVCYKKTERFQQTEQILNKCIRTYSKYYEAYIYRGKLYLKMKHYRNALQDFDKAITIDSSKQIGYVGKGDCLRLMEKYDEAKHYYTVAFNSKKNNVSLLLRRAICNMEIRRFEAAIEDINKLLESDFENSEAYYFKGLIFSKLKQPNDAIICYEQAIKHNSNKRAVTRAIYEITKIKIENRDYYEALFTLERAQYLDIDEKVVKKFRIFINGVTSMMKKNYMEGIKILTELLQDQDKPLSNFLRPLFFSTRSYGFMAMEKYQDAKDDLQAMEKDFSLDLPNLYNKFVCEGIIACNNQRYENALTLFSKANKALSYRIEPAFYKALTLICFSTKLIPKEMKDKKKEYLESAMRTITKVETVENNPSLYMIRGLLHYSLSDLDAALKDFDQCLNESTKPNPMVFYLIGLVFAETGRYSDAIGEFKRAIDNDEKHLIPEAYLSRAKCMLLTDEINTGFIDLQSYMTYRPSSPEIHVWAGHLLFFIRAYEDANKAYSNVNNINKNFDVLFHKVKCFLIVKDVLNALTHLKMMLDIRPDPKTSFDYDILECLRECSEESMTDYEGILRKMKQAKKKSKGDFGLLIDEYSYQFYKGIMYFYCGDVAAAKKNFNRALTLIQNEEAKEDLSQNEEEFINEFNGLSFTNLPFNYHEILYNIVICNIKEGNITAAHKSVMKVMDNLPSGEIKDEYQKMYNVLNQEIKNQRGRRSDQIAQILPFPVQNRLCSIFPDIQLDLSIPIVTKLFFCLPHVRKPDIIPKFEEKILEEFSMASIQVKPEAPWIRRSDQGVIFTDEVVKYDIEISQSSSESDDRSSEDDQDEENMVANAEELFAEDRIHGRRQISDDENYHAEGQQEEEAARPRMTGNQLRQFFKLDAETNNRLANINR